MEPPIQSRPATQTRQAQEPGHVRPPVDLVQIHQVAELLSAIPQASEGEQDSSGQLEEVAAITVLPLHLRVVPVHRSELANVPARTLPQQQTGHAPKVGDARSVALKKPLPHALHTGRPMVRRWAVVVVDRECSGSNVRAIFDHLCITVTETEWAGPALL